MSLKTFNPVTPSTRQLIIVDREGLWKGRPEKSLVFGKTKTAGRNNHGRITSRRRGGGHKQLYRMIDFVRSKVDMEATVERIEYDPNRTCHIALLKYEDGTLSYIIAPQKVAVGDRLVSGQKVEVRPGNSMPLGSIPMGTIVHNVEMKPGKGGQLARSAGSYVQYVGRDGGHALIKLSSGEVRLVSLECRATVGAVSNPDQKNINLGKAGRSRWLGRRPEVRGIAMNPVDHPHGGRTNGGRHPVTPWGLHTKGKKTRSNKSTDKWIVSRRKKK
jgi:large subunit ribosomal protein L2